MTAIMNPAEWEHGGLKFKGLSLAGVRTSITMPQHSLCFDVAQGLPYSIAMSNFLITHGHMDHASGIPYIISQKAMNAHKPARFFMPPSMVAPLKEIMKLWELIEGHHYEFEMTGLSPNEEFELSPHYFIKPFETIHRVASQGYSFYRKFRKLRKDLHQASKDDITKILKEGQEVTEEKSEILVSFTGDTQVEFLDRSPEVLNSKILFVEATYIDERKTITNAKEWGHIHLDELIPRLNDIKSEKIVLIHTSARYSTAEAQSIVLKKIPIEHQDRIVLFQGR